MTLTRGFIRNAATTPLDARLMDMAGLVCNADGSPRTGVLGGTNASIVATTGTMNLAVSAAEFVTSKGKADGVAIFTNDGVVNVPVTAAPVSNSRIDVLWVKHEDNTTGDAASLPIFGVTAGVAGAVPVKPAIPTGATELATLRIYSGTVATNGGSNLLTNTYQMTAARGGLVPFRNKADIDLWTTATVGQLVMALDTAAIYRRTAAGAWSVVVEDTGWITPTFVGGWSAATPTGYRRFNGVVYFRGRITGGITAAAFVLPAGFIIGSGTIYSVGSGSGTPPPAARVTILTSGNLEAVNAQEPNLGVIQYIADN